MKTTFEITGMTCGNCARHVREALESVSGVIAATVELATGLAIVEHDENAELEAMIAAAEEEGYGAQVAASHSG